MEELFEFDLSDVDVAAFESVATTPPHTSSVTVTTSGATITGLQAAGVPIPTLTTSPAPHQENEVDQKAEQTLRNEDNHHQNNHQLQIHDQQPQQQQHHHHHLHQHQHQPNLFQQQIQLQLQQQQHQQLQHHVSQQIASATGQQQQQPCKILLIPINSTAKPGTPSIKHILQLPPSASPISMSTIKTTASGNKKQILKIGPTNDEHHNQIIPQPTPQHTNMIANDVPKRKPCNCTKSQCLKLYCDCFANGEFCSGCNCTNCFNSLSKEKERQKAITQCLERNPEAFRPKIGKAVKSAIGEPAPDSIERRHTKGCNCKRSGCLKNYCECYEAKILCSNLCKCCGCKNYEESFERKSLMQLANSSSESARGILKNLLPTNNHSRTGKEFRKSFITKDVINASLACLLQSAQQAEKDSTQPSAISSLIQIEMGKCLRMIVDSATDSLNSKKRMI